MLNTMIKQEDIRGFPLDNMKHLRVGLLARHRENPDKSFVIYKSDVSEAYRLLPMHPLWQIKQVITIDGDETLTTITALGDKDQPEFTYPLMAW